MVRALAAYLSTRRRRFALHPPPSVPFVSVAALAAAVISLPPAAVSAAAFVATSTVPAACRVPTAALPVAKLRRSSCLTFDGLLAFRGRLIAAIASPSAAALAAEATPSATSPTPGRSKIARPPVNSTEKHDLCRPSRSETPPPRRRRRSKAAEVAAIAEDTPISAWLESVSKHMVQYASVFEEAGIETTEFLTLLESDDRDELFEALQAANIKKMHLKVLAKAIDKLLAGGGDAGAATQR